jgi:CTP:molybdopterin cytidylyltransferase MocA
VIYGVVLAAGASSRYGTSPPKQQVFLPRVLAALDEASLDGVLVVTGAHEVDASAQTVQCPEWRRGPGASLRCGLAALPDAVEAAVVVLADGPELDPRAIERLIESWRVDGGDVVAASYDGVRLHPVLLAKPAWGRVPDEGARALEARLVESGDLVPPGDVDVRR